MNKELEMIARLKAVEHKWSDVELDHALGAMDAEYEKECIIRLENGREVHCPAAPLACDYVRVVQEGFELAYWVCDEWEESPMNVMGAFLGCMKAGDAPEPRFQIMDETELKKHVIVRRRTCRKS